MSEWPPERASVSRMEADDPTCYDLKDGVAPSIELIIQTLGAHYSERDRKRLDRKGA